MEATREFVPDPTTARAFFTTIRQGPTLGRPEILVQDAPANMNGLSDLTSISRMYEHGPLEAYPHNLQIIEQRPPFEDSQTLRFGVRFFDADNDCRLKRMLEINYLHNQPAQHGIIVLVPMMKGRASKSYWGEPLIPSPHKVSQASLDSWIQKVANRNGEQHGAMQ